MASSVARPVEFPPQSAFTFGQILVQRAAARGYWICHRDDVNSAAKLRELNSPEDALEIAGADDEGRYRPLKTAPNLRHGWRLELKDLVELMRALETFYPGRTEVLQAFQNNRLSTSPLRETLNRQSGMYRIAATISDAELDDLIGRFCRSNGGCLRTILWKRDSAGTIPSSKLPSAKFDPTHDQAIDNADRDLQAVNVPLLCQEACNLLVAECRNVVKSRTTG
jgi:sirohydrochlorin cobaltochelatase